MSTNKVDDSYISNRQEKMLMYFSHISDNSSCNNTFSKSNKSLSSENKIISEQTNLGKSIDFLVPPKKDEKEEKIVGRHFMISYKARDKHYTVMDLGIGYGIFASVEEPLELKDSVLINLCQTYIVANLSFEQLHTRKDAKLHKTTVPNLKLKVFGGESQGEEYLFKSDESLKISDQEISSSPVDSLDQSHKPIKILIGRSELCHIQIKDKMLSRVQCTITFNPDRKCWQIQDGYNGRRSTNGIWWYLKESQPIVEGMKLKANQTIFK